MIAGYADLSKEADVYDYNFLEHYANETITDAREFMERERLTRHGGTLEAGQLPTWVVIGLVIILVGMVIIAL
jgi:hypothetical protein